LLKKDNMVVFTMTGKNQKPLVTCSQKSCDDCDIRDKIVCVADIKDIIDFGVLAVGYFIPVVAGMILGQFWTGLLFWIVLWVFFLGYFEARVLCRHCPHYGEPGFFLRCHANYGLPKIPLFDPGPASRYEQAAWLIYTSVLVLWYIPFFILSGQWLLLLIASWGLFAAVWTVMRTQCTRCYNLSCPANRIPDDVKEKFFEKYPVIAKAWRQ
jgi:hypothetical protein